MLNRMVRLKWDKMHKPTEAKTVMYGHWTTSWEHNFFQQHLNFEWGWWIHPLPPCTSTPPCLQLCSLFIAFSILCHRFSQQHTTSYQYSLLLCLLCDGYNCLLAISLAMLWQSPLPGTNMDNSRKLLMDNGWCLMHASDFTDVTHKEVSHYLPKCQ